MIDPALGFIWIWAAIGLAGLLLLLVGVTFSIAGRMFSQTLMRPENAESGGVDLTTLHDFDSHDSLLTRYAEDKAWLLENASPEDWSIETGDAPGAGSGGRLVLRASAFRPAAASHDHVLLIHGYGSSAKAMMPYARAYVSRGFHAVVPDCRGHGRSDGRFITMGWLDRLDAVRWVGRILADDPSARIILHGVSMGAATVMLASGEPLPPAVRCLVEDCGYTSASEIMAHHLRRNHGLPAFPIMPAADWFCRRMAGFSFYSASPIQQLALCRIPILCIHGEADRFVPLAMLDRILAAAPEPKARFVVPGAGHGMSAFVLGDTYYNRVLDFATPFLQAEPAAPDLLSAAPEPAAPDQRHGRRVQS